VVRARREHVLQTVEPAALGAEPAHGVVVRPHRAGFAATMEHDHHLLVGRPVGAARHRLHLHPGNSIRVPRITARGRAGRATARSVALRLRLRAPLAGVAHALVAEVSGARTRRW
jgi:hypothetical protein